jgi:hypothetical protein
VFCCGVGVFRLELELDREAGGPRRSRARGKWAALCLSYRARDFYNEIFRGGTVGLTWAARSSLGVWTELTSCEIAKLAFRQIRIA